MHLILHQRPNTGKLQLPAHYFVCSLGRCFDGTTDLPIADRGDTDTRAHTNTYTFVYTDNTSQVAHE